MGGKYNCPELNSSNWPEFSMRFRSVVAAKGYSDALTEVKSVNSEKVKGLLGQYVAREFLRLVDKADSAKEAWDSLRARFEQANAANAIQLQQQFTELQLEPDESIAQYVDRVLTLADNLEDTGNKASETQLAVQLLRGLPEQYSTIRTFLLHGDKLPDITTIQQKLVLEEKQLQHSRPSRDTAFFNKTGGSWKGARGRSSNSTATQWQRGRSAGGGNSSSGGGFRGRSRERYRRDSSRDSRRGRSGSRGRTSGDSNRFTGRCYACGKRGHKKEECRSRRDKQEEIALTCYALSQQAEAAGLNPDTDWIIDSGASRAISGNLQLFSTLQYHNSSVDCGIGSGQASGVGSVRLQPNNTSLYAPVRLKALYVPGYKYNLLPMRKLVAVPGIEIKAGPEALTISRHGEVVAVARTKGGLWVLQGCKAATALESLQGEVAAIARGQPSTAAPGTGASAALAGTVAAAARVTPEEWHRRMGHLSYGSLAQMVERNMVTGVDVSPAQFRAAGETTCDICQRSKQTVKPFQPASSSTSAPLELVHSDLCGPISPATPQGERYIFTLLDDYTGLSIVQLLRDKQQARTALADGIALLERQSGEQLRQFRSDNGGEYVNHAVNQLLRNRGIAPQNSMPYTPQQNGKAERLNRTLIERIRAMLLESGLPKQYWGEAAHCAAFVRNRSPAAGKAVTPYELFTGRKPDLSGLQPFGAVAYALTPKQQRGGKLADVSARGTLLGYASNGAGYRVLLDSGKVVSSRNVVFAKEGKRVTFDSSVGSGDSDSDSDADTPPGLAEGDESDDDFADPEPEGLPPATALGDGGQPSSAAEGSAAAAAPPGPAAAAAGGQQAAAAEEHSGANSRDSRSSSSSSHSRSQSAPPTPLRSSARSSKGVPSGWYKDMALAAAELIPEPKHFGEAINSEQAELWWDAMDDEMASLTANGTWSLVDLPPDKVALPTMWAYKVKRDGQGNFERGKARLVAKGCRQVEGRDFDETFAPVSKYTTFRAVAAIAAAHDLEIHQLDIKTAFLQGELEEEVYVQQPEGYQEGDRSKVYLLHKALYGLKQAPRAWHTKLHAELTQLGFRVSEADAGLYIYHHEQERLYLLVYVDDMLLVSSSIQLINSVKQRIMTAFEARDLGEAVSFLGINILRDRGSRTISLIQRRATDDIISRFGLTDAKPVSVPLSNAVKLSKEEGAPLDRSAVPYMQMVGSINYLATCTRPDIQFAAGALSRFMSCPTTVHAKAAKTVGRYIKGTADYGITYSSSGNSNISLGEFSDRGSSSSEQWGHPLGFCDADYAGDVDTRRSTTGYVFTLYGGAISWQSKRQPTVAVSTAEAEYMAAAAAVKEALWLGKLMCDLGMPQSAMRILGDNQAALKLLRNPITSLRSKHIDIVHHFARERVLRGEVMFGYVSTDEQMADVLTKPLASAKHSKCTAAMGVGKVE